MKTLNVALLTLVLIAPALRASTETGANAYLQASAVYAIPNDNFKSGTGASLAAGVSFAKHHAIEMEVISFNTERNDPGYYLHESESKLKLTPLLMTYRYSFLINNKSSVFVGFSAGVTYAKYEINSTYQTYYTGPVYHSRTDGTDATVTGGPQMGFAYELSAHSAVTFSVKAMYMGATYASSNGAFTTLQLGYRFTF